MPSFATQYLPGWSYERGGIRSSFSLGIRALDQPSQEARTGHWPETGSHSWLSCPARMPLPQTLSFPFRSNGNGHKLQREGREDRHLDSAPPPTPVPSCTGLVCCESTFHLPASQAPPLLSQSQDAALLGMALDWGWCPGPEAMHWLSLRQVAFACGASGPSSVKWDMLTHSKAWCEG